MSGRAASVLMPLARKSTDVVAEVRRACQRGRRSACAKKEIDGEEAVEHKLGSSDGVKSSQRIGYARETCIFIARLLSDDRCCNRTHARDAKQ